MSCGARYTQKNIQPLFWNLPTPDQQPGHEEQLPKERNEKESHIGIRQQEWAQFMEHPAQTGDNQQNPENPGDVTRTENQVTQQKQVDAEQYQAKTPFVAKGFQQKINLGMQLLGADDRQQIRCVQQAENGHKFHQANQSDHRIHQPEPRGQQGQ